MAFRFGFKLFITKITLMVSLFEMNCFYMMSFVLVLSKFHSTKLTLVIFSIGIVSIAKIFPLIIFFEATCDQPPGLDPKSNKFVFLFKNLNFLSISMSLKADLDLYPSNLDFLKKGSLCCFLIQFFEDLFLFNFNIFIKYLRLNLLLLIFLKINYFSFYNENNLLELTKDK